MNHLIFSDWLKHDINLNQKKIACHCKKGQTREEAGFDLFILLQQLLLY